MIDPVIFESLQTKIDEESVVIDVSYRRSRLVFDEEEEGSWKYVMKLLSLESQLTSVDLTRSCTR